MNWPYLKRNIAGIVLLIVTVGGLLFFWVINPDLFRKNYGSPGYMNGFGPEWDCLGSRICFKRPMKSDKSN
jgi:hypothetical protein